MKFKTTASERRFLNRTGGECSCVCSQQVECTEGSVLWFVLVLASVSFFLSFFGVYYNLLTDAKWSLLMRFLFSFIGFKEGNIVFHHFSYRVTHRLFYNLLHGSIGSNLWSLPSHSEDAILRARQQP